MEKWGVFLSSKRGITDIWQRDMIRFLNCIFDCNSMRSIWKYSVHVFKSTENGVASINWYFFWPSWNLPSGFGITMESASAYFLLLAGLHLANYQNACNDLPSCESTALRFPHVLDSAQTVLITHHSLYQHCKCLVVVAGSYWCFSKENFIDSWNCLSCNCLSWKGTLQVIWSKSSVMNGEFLRPLSRSSKSQSSCW